MNIEKKYKEMMVLYKEFNRLIDTAINKIQVEFFDKIETYEYENRVIDFKIKRISKMIDFIQEINEAELQFDFKKLEEDITEVMESDLMEINKFLVSNNASGKKRYGKNNIKTELRKPIISAITKKYPSLKESERNSSLIELGSFNILTTTKRQEKIKKMHDEILEKKKDIKSTGKEAEFEILLDKFIVKLKKEIKDIQKVPDNISRQLVSNFDNLIRYREEVQNYNKLRQVELESWQMSLMLTLPPIGFLQ